MGFGVIGPRGQRQLVTPGRFVPLTALARQIPQLVMSLGVARPASQCLLETCRRLVQPALPLQGRAEIEVCFGAIGTQVQRLLELLEGLVELTLISQHQAQVVVHLDQVGPQREYLAIRRRRLGQPAGLMMRDRLADQSIELGAFCGRLSGAGHQPRPSSGEAGERSFRTAWAMRSKTSGQSPRVGWRKSRIVGYQGESSRSSSQRNREPGATPPTPAPPTLPPDAPSPYRK